MTERIHTASYPELRMRRLRSRPFLRDMLRAPDVVARKLIWPVFLKEGKSLREEISSLPGQYYYSPDELVAALEPVTASGVRSILLFPDLPDHLKDADGSAILMDDSLMIKAIKQVKAKFPNIVVFADLDLSEYTTHGHSGVINDSGFVRNDHSLRILAEAAACFCRAGADGVAPSGMLDGQVFEIRKALDAESLKNSLILSYSTKFASRFYDCFRQAVHNTPQYGSRADCQIPMGDTHQSIRESVLDECESADILMVKPTMAYLDIIREIRMATKSPLAAFNVSGEYAMTWHAEALGIGSRYALAHEILNSIFRAGADLAITYWANQISEITKFNED